VYEDELTDGYLFRRIRRDDRHAFGILLRRYEQDLRRLTTHLLADLGEVDAVMFRAAGRAWRYRGLARVRGSWRGSRGSSPADWLYRVVYNTCVEELRRQPRAAAPAVLDGAGTALPEVPAEQRMAALRALHPALRVPLVLLDGEGFSMEAASRILQRDPADVAADVERARRRWRELAVGAPGDDAPDNAPDNAPDDAPPQAEPQESSPSELSPHAAGEPQRQALPARDEGSDEPVAGAGQGSGPGAASSDPQVIPGEDEPAENDPAENGLGEAVPASGDGTEPEAVAAPDEWRDDEPDKPDERPGAGPDEAMPEPKHTSRPAHGAQAQSRTGPDDAAAAHSGDGATLEQATRAALASLPAPAPSRRFWSNLDDALIDEPNLGVAARPAIRPITQLPGAGRPNDDRKLFPRSDRSKRVPSPSPSGRWSRRRVIVTVLAIAFIGVFITVGLLGDPEEDRTLTTGTTTPDDEELDPEPEPEEEPPEPEQEPTPPPTPPPPPGLESSVPLTPSGVGPLETGAMTLRDVGDTIGEPEIDLPTFEGRAGTCYDARLPGAPDLILRVRSPNPTQGVADPLDGILSSITVTAEVGSSRETDRGIGLGSSEDQLLGAHAGELVPSQNPFVPGGNIYLFRAPDGSGNGIAYVTDGQQVREISVGAADVIRLPDPCG
jgi:DNA-directed RNA polymerase specialized sigma24 family protein